MKLFVILCLLLSFSLSIPTSAQEKLSLQQAIEKALQQNFDLKIAEQESHKAATNNTWGNAGMLPNINGNGFYNFSTVNVKNLFSNGTVQERNGAISNNYGGGLSAGIRIFAAGRTYLIKKQLNQLQQYSEEQLKLQVQTIVAQVTQAYALLVLQRQKIMATDTALALAKLRMVLSQVQYESGLSAKVNYLQSRVDYNSRQSDSLQLITTTQEMFADINYLMGEDPYRTYLVEDSLPLNSHLQATQKELLSQHNLSISLAKRNWEVSKLNARATKAALLPTLDINTAYNFNRNESQAGFALFNQSLGFTSGATLSLPIFQGGNLRRVARIASLQAMQNEILVEKQQTEIARQYRKAWSAYEINKAAYWLEKQNIEFAKENLDIQKARFRVGIATNIETREAENSYVAALVRLYNAAYNFKVSETKVLELENGLVDELEINK